MGYVVGDASSLILLTKAEIIHKFLQNKTVYITKTVEEEAINRGKEKGRKDAYILEDLIDKGKIERKSPTKTSIEKTSKLFNLHKGEKEAVALASELNVPLMCDDKKAYNACEVMDIKHTTALNILLALYEKDKIDKNKAKNSLKKLEKFGWYTEKLIKNVKSKIGD